MELAIKMSRSIYPHNLAVVLLFLKPGAPGGFLLTPHVSAVHIYTNRPDGAREAKESESERGKKRANERTQSRM